METRGRKLIKNGDHFFSSGTQGHGDTAKNLSDAATFSGRNTGTRGHRALTLQIRSLNSEKYFDFCSGNTGTQGQGDASSKKNGNHFFRREHGDMGTQQKICQMQQHFLSGTQGQGDTVL